MTEHSSSLILPAGREDPALPSVEVSQSPEEKFREYLASRPRPKRFTGQQRDIVRYIFSKHNHFDADQLIDEMKQEGLHVSPPPFSPPFPHLLAAAFCPRPTVGARPVFE